MSAHLRHELTEVMRGAAPLPLDDLTETYLRVAVGRRPSKARTYAGLGEMEGVVDWTSDRPYSAIHWGLSAQTTPRRRLIVMRQDHIVTDWSIVVDCGVSMKFGTSSCLKRTFALQLAASFAQTAAAIGDRVSELVFDEVGVGVHLEAASAEEMVLAALMHEARLSKAPRAKSATAPSGLTQALTRLPGHSAIVPVISDFIALTETDKERLVRASRQHRLLCLVVEDEREIRFPSVHGQLSLVDLRSGQRSTMTFAEAGKRVAADRNRRLAELTDFFDGARIAHQVFETGEPGVSTRRKLLRLLQDGA